MQIILIGSGVSIKEGIYNGLWERIKDSFTLGINHSYKYFESTALICLNYVDFYDVNRQELKELPLIITCTRPHPSEWEDNTILVKNRSYALSGIMALDIATKILGEKDEIYLLGYDYGAITNIKDSQARDMTHFYQGNIEHRGIGVNGYYAGQGHAYRDFDCFMASRSKIYNVSEGSNIPCFPLISYTEFFEKLNNTTYQQDILRDNLKEKLK